MALVWSRLLEHQVLPVDEIPGHVNILHDLILKYGGKRNGRGVNHACIIRNRLPAQRNVLVGIVDVEVSVQCLDAGITVVGDFASALLSPLGGHEDDAVARAGTVDGLRCGIFQYLNRLNIIRIHHSKLRIRRNASVYDI